MDACSENIVAAVQAFCNAVVMIDDLNIAVAVVEGIAVDKTVIPACNSVAVNPIAGKN